MTNCENAVGIRHQDRAGVSVARRFQQRRRQRGPLASPQQGVAFENRIYNPRRKSECRKKGEDNAFGGLGSVERRACGTRSNVRMLWAKGLK